MKQEGKTSVESESCITEKHRCVIHGVFKGFTFRFWRTQINVCRVKINHLLFIAKDLTVCIKLRNCDILYQFHLWLFLFMTGSVYFSCSSANKQTRFHVNGIERASRLDMQTSLDFIQWQTYSETRYTHCSGEKQNSSKTWINLTSYDTFNQTVKLSVTLLTLCVSGNFAY